MIISVVAAQRRRWRHQGCLALPCRAPPPPSRLLLISGPRQCIGCYPQCTRPRALVAFNPVYSRSFFGLNFSSFYDPVYLYYLLVASDPWMQARTRYHQRRAAVRGTMTSTPGGPIQTVHVVAEHGDPLVLQPVSQVLGEFSVLCVAKIRAQDVRRNDYAGLVLHRVSGFISDRSAMDMDMAHYLMMELTKNATTSAAKGWYRKLLAEKILNNLTGILSFCNKLPEPESSILKELRVDAASIQAKLAKQRQYIPRNTETSLDAPEIVDD